VVLFKLAWSKRYPDVSWKIIRKLSVCYDNMIHRCYTKTNKDYSSYGGSGIDICKEWKIDRHIFISWGLQNGFTLGLEIDRINNKFGYNPNNCRFVNSKEQRRNERRNKINWEEKTKICPRCGQIKSWECFTWDKKKNIPRSHCKKCRVEVEKIRKNIY